jgi:hypothetical protein
MSDRPKVLDDDDDLSRFAPPSVDRIREVATAGGFPSRQTPPLITPRPPREPYRYRTGRTEQFSARIRPEAFDAFYDIARKNGWKIGETVEAALAALQEKLGQGA